MHRIIAPSLLLGLLLDTATAHAADAIEYTLRAGASHSDNVTRSPAGAEESSSAAVAGIELRGARTAGRLRYDVLADISHHEYLQRGLPSEQSGRGWITGSYDFTPETFSWHASAAYEQAREDILRPLAPGNQDDMVTLSTGPVLRLRFSDALFGQIDGRFTRLFLDDQPDSETIGGRALVARRTTPRAMLALGASFDDVSYRSVPPGSIGVQDFRRKEAFLRMELSGVRTEMEVEGGYAKVSGEQVDDSDAMLRARLSRRLTPALTGYLHAVREYPTSSTTNFYGDAPLGVGGSADGSILTSTLRLRTSAEAGLRLDRPRTGAELAYARHKESAASVTTGSRRYDEIRGRVSREMTPRVRGSVYASLLEERLSLGSGRFEETALGAQLDVALGRALGLDFRVEHRERNATAGFAEYSELSFGVLLRYRGNAAGVQ